MNFVSIRSRLRRSVKTLLFLLGAYFCIAQLLSRITVNKNPDTGNIPVYILTTGVHTDILLPIQNDIHDWSRSIKFEHTLSKSTQFDFVAFGWGDKGFYLETPEWEDLKASVALKAMSGLSSTAMHTTFYNNPQESESCKKMWLTEAQYQKLITYIQNSFQVSDTDEFIQIETDAVYGTNDAFYEANGSYSLFTTCNSWANKALKVSDQKACLWTPFDNPIFDKYSR